MTGLNTGQFYILVGQRDPELNEEMNEAEEEFEKKFNPYEKQE